MKKIIIIIAALIFILSLVACSEEKVCYHTFGEWEVSIEPRCDEEGIAIRACKKCGEIEEDSLQPLEHEEQTMNGIAATCTEEGRTDCIYCSVCNYILYLPKIIEPHGHSETILPGDSPTCLNSGYSDGKVCTICGITLIEQEYLSPMGHQYIIGEATPSTCATYGLQGSEICSFCGFVNKKATIVPLSSNHNFSNGKCTICGELQNANHNLKFEFNTDHYVVTGIGKVLGSEIIIPVSHNGYFVTVIDGSAFYNNPAITKVIIPEGVTTIGTYAFNGCSSLSYITYPATITHEGNHQTFESCTSLKSLVIGSDEVQDSPTVLGQAAFRDCTALETIKFGNSVQSISWGAFFGCSALKTIDFGEGIKTIEDESFEYCDSLKTLILPPNLEIIGGGAFLFCDNLESISFNTKLKKIDKLAFGYCKSLKEIKIPTSVKIINDEAFAYCNSLETVIIGDDCTENELTILGSLIFNKCIGLKEVVIGNSVENIGYSCFANCSSLSALTIGNSITYIGKDAFSNCTKLAEINYVGTKAQWELITKEAGWNNNMSAKTVICSDGTLTIN